MLYEKPCKTLLFGSCGEYPLISVCLPKYGRFAPPAMAFKALYIELFLVPYFIASGPENTAGTRI
jgi:hypothetical protein